MNLGLFIRVVVNRVDHVVQTVQIFELTTDVQKMELVCFSNFAQVLQVFGRQADIRKDGHYHRYLIPTAEVSNERVAKQARGRDGKLEEITVSHGVVEILESRRSNSFFVW